jgi:osmoprotectant transport system permease protein
MRILADAWDWLTTGSSWLGESGPWIHGPDGSLRLARDSIIGLGIGHLYMAAAAVGLAAAIALPLGLFLGHVRRGGTLTVVIANVSRAVPTLALLTLFASGSVGFGNRAVIIAVAVFAIPPILTNTFTGMTGVDADVRDAAKGLGMSRRQIIVGVELPLALPLIATGLRTSAVQAVATIPLAALVAGGGLGVIINYGLSTQHYGQALAGAVLVAALSMGIDAVLGRLQRRLTPVSLRAGRSAPA